MLVSFQIVPTQWGYRTILEHGHEYRRGLGVGGKRRWYTPPNIKRI